MGNLFSTILCALGVTTLCPAPPLPVPVPVVPFPVPVPAPVMVPTAPAPTCPCWTQAQIDALNVECCAEYHPELAQSSIFSLGARINFGGGHFTVAKDNMGLPPYIFGLTGEASSYVFESACLFENRNIASILGQGAQFTSMEGCLAMINGICASKEKCEEGYISDAGSQVESLRSVPVYKEVIYVP